MKRLGILVSGQGSNMEAIIKACRDGLLDGVAEPAVVLSDVSSAPALELARSLDVPAEAVDTDAYSTREEHEQALLEMLRAHQVDMVILAGYGRLLTATFLGLAPGPVLNIHPVPTHWYQGTSGYEQVWSQRESLETNFPTVHFVDRGVDTGRVLLFGLPYPLAGLHSLADLRERGLEEEHLLYPEAIHYLLTVPGVGEAEPESSTYALSGVSQFGLDLMVAAAEAKRKGKGPLECMAQRDWQGTGYRIQLVEGQAKVGWLAGTERAAFTRLLSELLIVSKSIGVSLLYEGLRIEVKDTRPTPGGRVR